MESAGLTSAMGSVCERLAAERMAASGDDDQNDLALSEPSNGSRSQGPSCPWFAGSESAFSSLLHVRLPTLRAATLTDVVGLFQRASDRVGDDQYSRVSIPSTGALAAWFSLFH